MLHETVTCDIDLYHQKALHYRTTIIADTSTLGSTEIVSEEWPSPKSYITVSEAVWYLIVFSPEPEIARIHRSRRMKSRWASCAVISVTIVVECGWLLQSFAQGSEESQVRKRRSSKLPASSLRPVKQIKPNAVLASIGKSDWQSSCTKKEFTPQQDVKIEPTQKEAQPETKSGKAGGDEIQATVKREQESKHFRAVEGNARSSEVAPGMQPVLVAKQEIQQSNMRSPEVSQRIQPSTVPNQETQQKAQIPHLSSVQPAAAVGQVLSTGKVKTEIKEKSCAKAALPEASPIAAERETDFLMRGDLFHLTLRLSANHRSYLFNTLWSKIICCLILLTEKAYLVSTNQTDDTERHIDLTFCREIKSNKIAGLYGSEICITNNEIQGRV